MDNNEVKRAFKGKVKELFTKKILSGYEPERVEHKVGDKWTDSDGVEWEQKEGYRSKVSKFNMGIFSKQCKDCETPCVKSFDIDAVFSIVCPNEAASAPASNKSFLNFALVIPKAPKFLPMVAVILVNLPNNPTIPALKPKILSIEPAVDASVLRPALDALFFSLLASL